MFSLFHPRRACVRIKHDQRQSVAQERYRAYTGLRDVAHGHVGSAGARALAAPHRRWASWLLAHLGRLLHTSIDLKIK